MTSPTALPRQKTQFNMEINKFIKKWSYVTHQNISNKFADEDSVLLGHDALSLGE
jgi:hypothetical protein